MRQLVQHALPFAGKVVPEFEFWELRGGLVQKLDDAFGHDRGQMQPALVLGLTHQCERAVHFRHRWVGALLEGPAGAA